MRGQGAGGERRRNTGERNEKENTGKWAWLIKVMQGRCGGRKLSKGQNKNLLDTSEERQTKLPSSVGQERLSRHPQQVKSSCRVRISSHLYLDLFGPNQSWLFWWLFWWVWFSFHAVWMKRVWRWVNKEVKGALRYFYLNHHHLCRYWVVLGASWLAC